MTTVLPAVAGRETADLLVDAAALSELVGRPVRATRLRHKPGLSTAGALVDAAGGEDAAAAPRWVQATQRAHLDKIRNAMRRARERGQRLEVVDVPGRGTSIHLVHGDLDSDPRLQRGLDAVRSTHPAVAGAVAAGRLEVLRYNPQRRLVLRCVSPGRSPLVIRVTAEKQADVAARLAALAERGVPVVRPVRGNDLPRTRRVSVWPWFGTGQLTDVGPAAEQTGAALARLHAADLPLNPVSGTGAMLATLVDAVADLRDLEPGAADRMAGLVRRLADRLSARDWPMGTAHGDFSADQVLVGGPGEEPVRLIDFDRSSRVPLAADLGSFAAVEMLGLGQSAPGPDALPLTGAVLEGYRAAGGRMVPAEDLGIWAARALLTRIFEPFREARPDWADAIHARLDQVAGVLGP